VSTLDNQLSLWDEGDIEVASSAVRDVSRPAVAREPATGTGAPVMSQTILEVFTDGACSGNPGPGGWAWATEDGRQGFGCERQSTNQRMEIMAALEAVNAIDGPLVVVSDSTYVVNCFRNRWWRSWHRTGWRTSAGKPVANRDLWEPLIERVLARENVQFRWIKGHAGHPLNELADTLAVAAAREASTAGAD